MSPGLHTFLTGCLAIWPTFLTFSAHHCLCSHACGNSPGISQCSYLYSYWVHIYCRSSRLLTVVMRFSPTFQAAANYIPLILCPSRYNPLIFYMYPLYVSALLHCIIHICIANTLFAFRFCSHLSHISFTFLLF